MISHFLAFASNENALHYKKSKQNQPYEKGMLFVNH